MKNIIRLENYYSPEELERGIAKFVNYYNNCRYHESLRNVTPADVYSGWDKKILERREKIKALTMKKRKQCNLTCLSGRQENVPFVTV